MVFEDPETGADLVTFTGDDLASLVGMTAEELEAASSGDPEWPEEWVGWSADGTAWGWESLADAFGIDDADIWAEFAVGRDFVIARVATFQVLDPADQSGPSVSQDDQVLPTRWFIAKVPLALNTDTRRSAYICPRLPARREGPIRGRRLRPQRARPRHLDLHLGIAPSGQGVAGLPATKTCDFHKFRGHCPPVDMSIGRQIRRLREAAGLRAADLAERLGVDPSAVSNLENDRRGVKADEVGVIADFLGVSQLAILEPDSLLGRLPVAHRTNGDQTASRDPLMRLTALAELHQVLTQGGHPAAVVIGEPPRPSSGWLQHATALADWALEFLPAAADGEDRVTGLAAAIEDRLGVDVMVESLGTAAPLGLSITDAEFSFILVNAEQLRSRASVHPGPRAGACLEQRRGHDQHRPGSAGSHR